MGLRTRLRWEAPLREQTCEGPGRPGLLLKGTSVGKPDRCSIACSSVYQVGSHSKKTGQEGMKLESLNGSGAAGGSRQLVEAPAVPAEEGRKSWEVLEA